VVTGQADLVLVHYVLFRSLRNPNLRNPESREIKKIKKIADESIIEVTKPTLLPNEAVDRLAISQVHIFFLGHYT
jgi:hypothetical protein